MSTLVQKIIEYGSQLEREEEASFDLWTWLPSSKSAEKAHDDYYNEFKPSKSEIMIEASKVMSIRSSADMTTEVVQKWFSCPCGCGVIDHKYIEEVMRA